MADYVQAKTLVKAIAKQSYGGDAISTINLEDIVAVDNYVNSSNERKELFTNTLPIMMAKMYVSSRTYEPILPELVMSNEEFGGYVKKVSIKLTDPIDNASYVPQQGQLVPNVAINKPEIVQTSFANFDVWQYNISTDDYLWKTAFLNWEQMSVFLSGISVSITNKMKIDVDNLIHSCINNFIASKLLLQKDVNTKKAAGQATVGNHAFNLLSIYNTLTNKTLTKTSWKYDADFLRWANAFMNKHNKAMSYVNEKIYNTGVVPRHTSVENLKVIYLDEFVELGNSVMQSDIFHNELTSLKDNFKTLLYWQGMGDDVSFESCSTIDVITSQKGVDESGFEVKQSGVVGFAFDKDALGVMFDRVREGSIYDFNTETTTRMLKVDKGMFNDLSENAIVYYIAEDDDDFCYVEAQEVQE